MITFLPGYQFQASLYLKWLKDNQSWRQNSSEKIYIISGSPERSWRITLNEDLFKFNFRITPGKILNRLINLKRTEVLKKIDDIILRAPNKNVLEKSRIVYGNAGYCFNSFNYLKNNNKNTKLYLDRACSHIILQEKILNEEYKSFGLNFKKINFIKNIHTKEYNLADKIVVPSNKTYESFIQYGVPEEKLIKQPLFFNFKKNNNIKYKKIHNLDEEKIFIGFLGGSFVRKGLIYLLKAWNELDTRNAVLLVKSSRKTILWTDEIKSLIKNNKNIIFLEDYIEDISDFYKSIDIFCMPSIEEGFGMALIEAFYYNCKIIASESIGSSELILNYKGVKIFKNRDYIDLAKNLEKSISQGKKKGLINKDFDLQISNKNYLNLFK